MSDHPPSGFDAISSSAARHSFARASAPGPAIAAADFTALLPPNALHFYQPVTRAHLHDVDGAQALIEIFADTSAGLYRGTVTARIGKNTFVSKLYAHAGDNAGPYRIDSLMIDNRRIDLADPDAARAALETFIAYKNAGLPAGHGPCALFPRPAGPEAPLDTRAPMPPVAPL